MQEPIGGGPLPWTLAIGFGGIFVAAVFEMQFHPVLGGLAAAAIAIAFFACLTFARRVVLTPSRLVEFQPVLARLARRFPQLASFETARRRTIELSELRDVRRRDSRLELRFFYDQPCWFYTGSEARAAELLAALQAYLRERGPYLRPVREQTVGEQIAVVARTQEGGRCPYCHDDVEADDREDCARCGAPHHVECMAIHRGCAGFSCQGLHKGSRSHVRS